MSAASKPRARIERPNEGYYVLYMGGREIGGSNRAALERYARTQGYVPQYEAPVPRWRRGTAWNPAETWDC